MLSLCRTRGLWTVSKRAERGIIARKYKKVCPCCNAVGGGGETVEHLLMECRKWEEERERCMGGNQGLCNGLRGRKGNGEKMWSVNGESTVSLVSVLIRSAACGVPSMYGVGVGKRGGKDGDCKGENGGGG